MNVCKCKLVFHTNTLQQKIEITDLKTFLAGENTIVLFILAPTVVNMLNNLYILYICVTIFNMKYFNILQYYCKKCPQNQF